jgi:hypothetical protein
VALFSIDKKTPLKKLEIDEFNRDGAPLLPQKQSNFGKTSSKTMLLGPSSPTEQRRTTFFQ